jgi:hypothetical protein
VYKTLMNNLQNCANLSETPCRNGDGVIISFSLRCFHIAVQTSDILQVFLLNSKRSELGLRIISAKTISSGIILNDKLPAKPFYINISPPESFCITTIPLRESFYITIMRLRNHFTLL